ncbi:MAG: hypothetical protein FWD42_11105, partial [Solirubrobacterales bacterium]|nr:hypothetical protein [Solirubrobacterales bacterium]
MAALSSNLPPACCVEHRHAEHACAEHACAEHACAEHACPRRRWGIQKEDSFRAEPILKTKNET